MPKAKERNIYPYAGGWYLNWQLLGHVYRKWFRTIEEAVAEREFCDAHRDEISKLLIKEAKREASSSAAAASAAKKA